MIVFHCFLSFVFFNLAPLDYNYNFNIVVCLFFILSLIPFLREKSNIGIINFYTLFYFSFFLVNFFYPLFIYPLDPEYFLTFTLGFNHEVVNKGTALAYLCSNFLILGSGIKIKFKKYIHTGFYNHNKLTILTTLLLIIFLGTVGKTFLSGNFVGASAFSLYILQVIVCLLIISSLIFYRNYSIQREKIIYYFLVILYVAILFILLSYIGLTKTPNAHCNSSFTNLTTCLRLPSTIFVKSILCCASSAYSFK